MCCIDLNIFTHFSEQRLDPWEYSSDILPNPNIVGRSKLKTGLWTKDGIIFLYSKLHHRKTFKIKLYLTYCITITIFSTNS